MAIRSLLSFVLVATLAACSNSTEEGDGPVFDTLDVPATTSDMTAAGVTGQGVLVRPRERRRERDDHRAMMTRPS